MDFLADVDQRGQTSLSDVTLNPCVFILAIVITGATIANAFPQALVPAPPDACSEVHHRRRTLSCAAVRPAAKYAAGPSRSRRGLSRRANMAEKMLLPS